MKIRLKQRIVLILLATGVVVCSLIGLEKLREAWACRNLMLQLRWQVGEYRDAHQGHFPSDIFSAMEWIPGGGSRDSNSVSFLVRCPGAEGISGLANREMTSDYIYINWESILGSTNVPVDYPLIYDRRYSNHFGLGINVVSVHGWPLWDFRAHRLKRFAAEHPEYHLPLPE